MTERKLVHAVPLPPNEWKEPHRPEPMPRWPGMPIICRVCGRELREFGNAKGKETE